MFQVFDSGKPADCHNYPCDPSWDCSTFPSFEEAIEYVRRWLGPYHNPLESSWVEENGQLLLISDDSLGLEVNVPYDYSGCGDTICIRQGGSIL